MKQDIETSRQTMKQDIEGARQAIRSDTAEQKAEIIKWVAGLIGFQTLAILGAVVALTRIIAN